jgi:flagellar protein FliS
MSSARELSRYGVVKVTTSTPGQLLVMLYDGLLRFLREAEVAMAAKERARAGERIGRSLAIIEQLLFGLNREALPTLCDKLEPLYRFCIIQLTSANLHEDPAKIGDVVRILAPLRDAWSTAVAQLAREASEAAQVSVPGAAP